MVVRCLGSRIKMSYPETERCKPWGGQKGLNNLGKQHEVIRDSKQRAITVVGDSLTRHLLTSSDQVKTFPAPSPGTSFIECGVFEDPQEFVQTKVWCNPGITTARMLNRLSHQPHQLMKLKNPSHIYLLVGTNDICPHLETVRNICAIAVQLEITGCDTTVIELLPRRAENDSERVKAINSMIRQLLPTVRASFLLKESRHHLYRDDTHLNEEGSFKLMTHLLAHSKRR